MNLAPELRFFSRFPDMDDQHARILDQIFADSDSENDSKSYGDSTEEKSSQYSSDSGMSDENNSEDDDDPAPSGTSSNGVGRAKAATSSGAGVARRGMRGRASCGHDRNQTSVVAGRRLLIIAQDLCNTQRLLALLTTTWVCQPCRFSCCTSLLPFGICRLQKRTGTPPSVFRMMLRKQPNGLTIRLTSQK